MNKLTQADQQQPQQNLLSWTQPIICCAAGGWKESFALATKTTQFLLLIFSVFYQFKAGSFASCIQVCFHLSQESCHTALLLTTTDWLTSLPCRSQRRPPRYDTLPFCNSSNSKLYWHCH